LQDQEVGDKPFSALTFLDCKRLHAVVPAGGAARSGSITTNVAMTVPRLP
jgi:hypothetical protein